MENQIKQLVSLAKRYRDYGQRALLKNDNHNELGDDATVYFADNYAVCVVYFNSYGKQVEVNLYSQKISLQFNTPTKDLQNTFIKYTEYLQKLEANLKANELTREQLVQQRVEELEKQIRDLKGETTV